MISLVITTCDRPALLLNAIESALNQKFVTEIVVVNDGRAPLEKLPVNIQLIHTAGYVGCCGARNLGLEAVSQPYIAYLDDDDSLHPDAFAGAMAAFEGGARQLVVSNVDRIENGKCVSVRVPPSTKKGTIWEIDFKALQGGYNFYTKQSTVYETEFLRSIGGWEGRLKSRSQCELFFRISQQADITGINRPCYRLNRDTSYDHLTTNKGLRFRSYLFLVTRHFGLWFPRITGWKWFVRESQQILRLMLK